MNILMVDDQYDVIQGMLEGIRWTTLQVNQVFYAYSVPEAQERFGSDVIDILLCDIEMPIQNGLELFRWVKSHYPNVECIFLTSHSDFEYVQEALKLGGFDYILQPARYEEIEETIRRAIEKIKMHRYEQKIYEYGAYWQQNEDILIDNCMRSYLLEQTIDQKQLLEDLSQTRLSLTSSEIFLPVLIQIIDHHHQLENWNSSLFKYALQNMLQEILCPYGTFLVLIQLNVAHYLLLFKPNSSYTDQSFDQFLKACEQHLECFIACYLGHHCTLSSLKQEYFELDMIRQDNIAFYHAVFQKEDWNYKQRVSFPLPDMEQWKFLMLHDSSQSVRTKAHDYLRQTTQQGNMSSQLLVRFTQNYVRMFLEVAREFQLKTQDLFFEHYSIEGYIGAYTSLEQTEKLIDFTIDYIQKQTGQNTDKLSPVEQAIAYINQNIEKDLSRNEIAEAVYLNPEYLSRLFKKAKGISLGDFIIARKMEIAQSLLSSTNIPVGIIASKVGYSNFSYFSQVFRKFCGLSPGEYRQQTEKNK